MSCGSEYCRLRGPCIDHFFTGWRIGCSPATAERGAIGSKCRAPVIRSVIAPAEFSPER